MSLAILVFGGQFKIEKELKATAQRKINFVKTPVFGDTIEPLRPLTAICRCAVTRFEGLNKG